MTESSCNKDSSDKADIDCTHSWPSVLYSL